MSFAIPSQAGTVVIVKATIGLDGTFNFTGSAGIGNFSLLTIGNIATRTFLGVSAGAHVVAEAEVSGFTLSSVICVSATLTSTFDISGASVSFQLGALDILTCTFLSVADTTDPTLLSFTRQSPSSSPTSADTLVFRATFGEAVQNVDASDFAVNGSTTATVTAVTPVSGSVYDVTVSGGDLAGFNGTVGLDLAGGQNIADLAANALPSGEPATDETYVLDNSGATLLSFTRQSPSSSPTSADTLVFRATFGEAVQNVDASDFAVNGSTTATVTAVTPVSGSVYDVTVSGGDLAGFNGTVGLDLAGGQNIADLAANALPSGEPATDETYVLDNAGPPASIAAPPSIAALTPFVAVVTFSEAVSGFTLAAVTVTNGSATGLSGSGASYSLVVTPDGSGDITIQVANGAAVNALGNESMGASATTALLQAPGTITIVKTTAPYGAGDGTFVYTSVDPDLDGVAITTSGQTGSVTVSKPAGLFEITENVESTWSLTSVSCSETIASNSVAVLADRKVTIQLEAGENVTCTFVSGRESDYVVGRTQRLISNFMARRADQMTASEPDLVQRMSNDCGGSADPLAVSGSGTSNSNTISMATNLQQLLVQNKAAKMPREDPEGGARPSSSDRSSACTRGPGVWVEGRWAHVANEMAKTDLGLLYVGIDYRLAEDFLFGLLTQFDWTRERDLSEGTDVAGFGWLTGPYVVARINKHLYFDARVAVGQSKNTVSPLESYTDEFDTDRWLVRSRLTGDFEWDGWRVSPELGIVYLDESQRRYVDNLGIVIPGQTVTLGRMTLGPTVGTTFEVPDIATISPQLKLSGIWDFDRTELVSVETGSPAASQKLRGRVEGGISANFGNGVSLTLEGFYDGIGLEQYDAYGGATRLSIQLN